MSDQLVIFPFKRVGEKDKMRGCVEHVIGFPNEFNKFNNTGARMQDSIYHMTLKSHFIGEICSKTSRFRLKKMRRFMDVNA